MKMNLGALVIILLFIASVLPFRLQAASSHPYSYLPKPPMSINYSVIPDKEIYEAGEIITFNVLAMLDTTRCDPNCEYRVNFGNLSQILVQSKLFESNVLKYYNLTKTNPFALISFKVQMINKYNPPFLEVELVRKAPAYATAKKQFQNLVIDQYDTRYITSRKYAKVRKSMYGIE